MVHAVFAVHDNGFMELSSQVSPAITVCDLCKLIVACISVCVKVSAEISVGKEIFKPFFSIWISEDVLLGDPKGTIAGADATHFSRIFRRW